MRPYITALLISVLGLGAGWASGSAPGAAHEPHAGLNFAISVDKDGDTTSDCPAPCVVGEGTNFFVNVSLASLGDVPSYHALDVSGTFAGISTTGAPDIVWPDCVFEAMASDTNEFLAGCTTGISAYPSTFTGLVLRHEFTCTASGSVTLHHGAALGHTTIIEDQGLPHSEGAGTSESLMIECGIPYTDKTFTKTGPGVAKTLTTSAGPYPGAIALITNAPGCPSPTIDFDFGSNAEVFIDWGVACVNPGESVTVRAYADCPSCSIGIGSGTWGYEADADLDGCPNAKEQQTDEGSELFGGRRNYLNPHDYFNPTHDGTNRVDDILHVVSQYGKNEGTEGYDPDSDRTLLGPFAWNLGPPDGIQNVHDILHAIRHYHHDCS